MNFYSRDEVAHILAKLGAQHISYHSNSIRSTSPCHGGDNRMGFAAWIDSYGEWRCTCHSHHCVQASSLEWLVRRVNQGSIQDATEWIAKELQRTDLIVSSFCNSRELAIQEDANPEIVFSGGEEEIARLLKVHPHHTYWQERGYSQELCSAFELTYRSLDYRALIPIRDSEGRLLGTMERSTNGEEPKYKWNSPNPNKGSFLFGVPQALQHPLRLDGRRVVFLVEGTLDPVKAVMHGYPVVASQTNHLSAAQAQLLMTNWDLIICLPDNDEAGKNLVRDLNKRLVPFCDLAAFTTSSSYKDLDSMPDHEIPLLLDTVLAQWRYDFSKLPRVRRSRMLELVS